MRIILTGLPGVGKTYLGNQLAKYLDLRFIDLDQYIVDVEGDHIPNIFEQKGEQYFRTIETKALEECLKYDQIVLATGGGTLCHSENLKKATTIGICVYIKDYLGAIANRIDQNRGQRPMFLGLNQLETEKKLGQLLKKRRSYYEQTHVITGLEAVSNLQLLTNRLLLFTKDA
ncbi:MAG: shikimate kinase [Bacteroidia bacterium]|nr:shikimate kinase [Bacteroidia bacterium]